MNSIIIMMLNKNNQTVKCNKRVLCGNTVKLSINRKSTNRSTSASSKKQLNKAKADPLGKTFKKTQLPTKSLKSRFDELVNEIFLKVDFDCSGFITYTKISFCKEIPQKIFYFLGGVFQKVRQLGGISLTMFSKLCEQAYLQAKLEDIEFLFSSEHETNKVKAEHKQSQAKIMIKVKKHHKQQEDQDKENRDDRFSTKKMGQPCPKFSLKIKTEVCEPVDRVFCSQRKLRLRSLHKDKQENQSMAETSRADNTSFQSSKVRILTEMLDRQIELNNKRLLAHNSN